MKSKIKKKKKSTNIINYMSILLKIYRINHWVAVSKMANKIIQKIEYIPSSYPSISSPFRSLVCPPCPESRMRKKKITSAATWKKGGDWSVRTMEKQRVMRLGRPDEPAHRVNDVLPRRLLTRVLRVVSKHDDIACPVSVLFYVVFAQIP